MNIGGISIPHFPALMLEQHVYMYDENSDHFGTINVRVFGVNSFSDRALGFHVMTDNGLLRSNVPISALLWKQTPTKFLPLDFLQLWDCFSANITCQTYDFLLGCRCKVIFKDKSFDWGEYLMTFDWFNNPWSNDPSQYKCLHLIKLDCGQFALQPNNRIFWRHTAWTNQPIPDFCDHKVDNRVFRCETSDRWILPSEDDSQYYYDFVEKKNE